MTTGSVISFFQPGTQPGLKASAQASGGANPFAALLASTGTGETPLATAADSLAEGQAEGRIDARFGTAGNAAMDPAGPVGARAADLPAPLHTLKALGEALGEFEDAPDFDDLPADLQHLVQQFDALPADMRAQLQGLIGDDALAGLASLGPVPGLTAAGEQAPPHSRPAAATPPPDSPALPQASASPRPGAWQHPMPNGGTEQANALAQGATNATPLAGAAANANAADMQATAASPALPAAPTPQGDLAEAGHAG